MVTVLSRVFTQVNEKVLFLTKDYVKVVVEVLTWIKV